MGRVRRRLRQIRGRAGRRGGQGQADPGRAGRGGAEPGAAAPLVPSDPGQRPVRRTQRTAGGTAAERGRRGAGAVRRAGLLRPRGAARGARVNISNLIASYGYWAVFLLVGAESLGIPLPGETALISAGVYAGHTHRLSPWLVFAVAAAGAIIGDNIGYWIGDKGAYRLPRPHRRDGRPGWAELYD